MEARHAVSSRLQRVWYLKRPSSPPAPARKVTGVRTVRACERVCQRVRECVRAGQQLNRPKVLRWAATVSRGSPVRSDAPRIPDSGDRPRGGKNPSWQRQLVRVLRMNTSCTRSSASKALLRFTLSQVCGVAACSLTPKRAP